MRILVANIPLPQNRFLVDLNNELSRHADLVHSSDEFWSMQGEYDVVHLHFPEYLTYAIEQAYHHGLTDELIEAITIRLRFWSDRSVIVVTRHVLLPHDARHDPMWEKLYTRVYEHTDGVVHFAQASVQEFQSRYQATKFIRGREPRHAVIPHHNYSSLPDTIAPADARRLLGIPKDSAVMLVFGAIRSDAERQLILDTFRAVRAPRKLLLVSRWRENLRSIAWIRLKYWVRDLTRLYYRLNPRYRFNYGFVEETDTQLYLNAADVLFIPRLWVLNSGNITLGMTFGKVVVGPDSWDVGELLRETGNPVFDPDRPQDAPRAVEKALELSRTTDLGERNRRLAMTEWTVDRCAALYLDFFTQLASELQSSQASA